ncbi:hypothetical protein [Pseudomonas mangiferae]|uniref:Oligosaccharide repeat unit polymerase n=1 Tax=Pseudomonas mangiferae TaxID=2593654 RepID=A0A553GWF7_9PSED|nr:hypothetical protein [Pseudomonas mangiferae]TRX73785.1 hypothetical protein FM069_15340 [Pseudomonas mangiferae]
MHADKYYVLKWLFPLLFFQIYLSLSVALFYGGPWPWPVDDPDRLLLYLLVAQLSILGGYLAGGLVRRPGNQPLDERKARRFFDVCLVLSLLMMIPTSLTRSGNALPDVLYGLQNAGKAYNENFQRLLEGNPYVSAEYVRILLSMLLTSTFPLLIYLWGQLSWLRRSLGIVVALFNVALYIAIGTNKGIADTFITLPFLLLVANWSGGIKFRLMRIRYLLLFCLAFALFLTFFAMGQKERAGNVGEAGYLPTGETLLFTDRQYGTYAQWMPKGVMIVYESLARYLGQGYYALSMSFDLDSPSTYGLGHSMFLSRNADTLLGTDYFTSNSLPSVLEKERKWSMMALWHSLYTWLASDLGHWGVMGAMFAFAFLLSVSWRRALDRQGVVWVTMLYMMVILFYYTPANNQLFQVGETSAAFTLAVLWLIFSGDRLFLRRPS